MVKNGLLLFFLIGLLFASCSTSNSSSAQIEKALNEKPEMIADLIKKNPEMFFSAFQEMAQEARKKAMASREENEEKEIEDYIKNPLKFTVRPDELIRGTKNAPITLVEYSDFECPFCSKGAQIVDDLLKKYDGKISFIYKHLPIDSIHANARLASSYHEAIRILAGDRAWEFHDTLLANQNKLRLGEKYLESIVKNMKLDLVKVKALLKDERVTQRIKDDEAEAQKLGFSGTPGFLINGVPVRGAYPVEHFSKIISKLGL